MMPLSWYVEQARLSQDFPPVPNGVMLQGIRKHAASEGSRVLLNGIGGDEWLGGSRIYYAEELAHGRWSKLYGCFKSDTRAFRPRLALAWLIRYGLFPLLPTGLKRDIQRLIRHGRGNSDAYWLSAEMQDRIASISEKATAKRIKPVRAAGQRELLETLDNTAYLDMGREQDERLNAGFALEGRRPLYTRALVQYAFSIPERLRLRGNQAKYIHVQALKGVMPHAILDRKDKAEFSVVFRRHLDGMKKMSTDTLPQVRDTWVTREGMRRLYTTYKERPLWGWPPWVLWSIHGCDMLHQVAVGPGSVAHQDPAGSGLNAFLVEGN